MYRRSSGIDLQLLWRTDTLEAEFSTGGLSFKFWDNSSHDVHYYLRMISVWPKSILHSDIMFWRRLCTIGRFALWSWCNYGHTRLANVEVSVCIRRTRKPVVETHYGRYNHFLVKVSQVWGQIVLLSLSLSNPAAPSGSRDVLSRIFLLQEAYIGPSWILMCRLTDVT